MDKQKIRNIVNELMSEKYALGALDNNDKTYWDNLKIRNYINDNITKLYSEFLKEIND